VLAALADLAMAGQERAIDDRDVILRRGASIWAGK
jgi:hypothetical protein